LERAEYYSSAGCLESAFEDYNKCLELNPHNIVALYNRGMLLFNRFNRADDALNDYNRCIEECVRQNASHTTLAGVYNNRGVLLEEVFNNYAQALRDFDTALSIYPQSSHASSNRRHLLHRISLMTVMGNL